MIDQLKYHTGESGTSNFGGSCVLIEEIQVMIDQSNSMYHTGESGISNFWRQLCIDRGDTTDDSPVKLHVPHR